MNYILFDDITWQNMLPLTFTRPVAELRIGILTIREKWEKKLNTSCFYFTQQFLQKRFRLIQSMENLLINSSIIPNNNLIDELKTLDVNQALIKDDVLVAMRVGEEKLHSTQLLNKNNYKTITAKSDFVKINYPWDIFSMNGAQIAFDYALITEGRKSQKISKTNQIIGNSNRIFLEQGANVECATLNPGDGFIYIGRNATVMEGAVLHGSIALCDHATIKILAKIYGPTTIGLHSKAAGEINNSVITGYSNKAHDGYLGNSVLGEWCNLGADTNISNLKNNYAQVRVWNYQQQRFISTGLQFCGLIMGDHSKCGINTMFNTGTVVGVHANIYGSGFPRVFIPSFAWGGAAGFTEYKLSKAKLVAEKVMARRKMETEYIETEKSILDHVFDITRDNRRF